MKILFLAYFFIRFCWSVDCSHHLTSLAPQPERLLVFPCEPPAAAMLGTQTALSLRLQTSSDGNLLVHAPVSSPLSNKLHTKANYSRTLRGEHSSWFWLFLSGWDALTVHTQQLRDQSLIWVVWRFPLWLFLFWDFTGLFHIHGFLHFSGPFSQKD